MEDPISIHSSLSTTSYQHQHKHQHHQQHHQHAHTTPTNQQKPFEFTRKKRWPDTVVAELVDIAILVFSQQGAILHCDAAVSHVLGYSEDQLLGSNFSSFLHEHDISVFFDAFNDSVALHSDLTSYVRIKPNPASAHPSQNQRPRLFEVKASPYYNAQNTDCVCVFAMLAPYPTFNSRRLDAFLPLKAENHLLNDRLADLKRNDADDTADDSATSSDVEMLHDTRTGTPESHVAIAPTTSYPFHHSSISTEYARSHHHHAHPLKAAPPPPAHKVKLRGSNTVADAEDITEAGSLKRKRRNDAQEGRVCTACGRNNSPEWRKGPQGPKTLCNACGLRWAKKAKKSPNAHEGFVNTAATAPAESA